MLRAFVFLAVFAGASGVMPLAIDLFSMCFKPTPV